MATKANIKQMLESAKQKRKLAKTKEKTDNNNRAIRNSEVAIMTVVQYFTLSTINILAEI